MVIHVHMHLQLLERRQGNQHYKKRQFDTALTHYINAVSILEPLQACTSEEQQELEMNLNKAYLNIAAVHLTQQYFGKAITWSTKALQKDRQNPTALMRRAKARLGRHNYQVRVSICHISRVSIMH